MIVLATRSLACSFISRPHGAKTWQLGCVGSNKRVKTISANCRLAPALQHLVHILLTVWTNINSWNHINTTLVKPNYCTTGTSIIQLSLYQWWRPYQVTLLTSTIPADSTNNKDTPVDLTNNDNSITYYK